MLECPANYFGKGEDYVLPEDIDVIQEFERKFQEWEAAHPDDPTGEIALAHAKKHNEPIEKVIAKQDRHLPPKSKEALSDVGGVELELTLPPDYVRLLKNYAKFKRRRPRDIVMAWISQFCKL